ncbi:hypothetical protein Taro_045490 [Colocasia esculenta]|uniref:Uncharacterized protein n=1 Tax=Colocasia esculenta TaxID=4460 RepID=A0A843WRF6_COLES|nr:hypothetical protein [Colocasia esculenta]
MFYPLRNQQQEEEEAAATASSDDEVATTAAIVGAAAVATASSSHSSYRRSSNDSSNSKETGKRLELLRSRRKAGNPELHPLHLLLHPEHRLGTSVDTTWDSVDTLSQTIPEGVLGRPLVSTPLELVSTHCPSLARRLELLRSRRKAGNPELHPLHLLLHPEHRLGTSVDTTWASVDTLSQTIPEGVLGRPLVSTPLELVSTHCPSLARRNQQQEEEEEAATESLDDEVATTTATVGAVAAATTSSSHSSYRRSSNDSSYSKETGKRWKRSTRWVKGEFL